MSTKPRVNLVFSKAILEVAKVGTMGAEIYGDHDWRNNPLSWDQHLDASLRHLLEYNNGNRIDKLDTCNECVDNTCKKHSGLSHLAHAAWRILALLDYELNGIGEDTLFKGYKK